MKITVIIHACLLVLFPILANANISVNVTATDNTHIFGGFGVNTKPWTASPNSLTQDGMVSDEAEDYLVRLIYADFDFAQCNAPSPFSNAEKYKRPNLDSHD
jgi:hypothetical protein